MSAMNPILRLRRTFRSMGAESEQADEAADAISDYGYGRRESDLRFERMLAEMRQQTAEMREYMSNVRNQILLAIMVASGIIIAAVGVLIAAFAR